MTTPLLLLQGEQDEVVCPNAPLRWYPQVAAQDKSLLDAPRPSPRESPDGAGLVSHGEAYLTGWRSGCRSSGRRSCSR